MASWRRLRTGRRPLPSRTRAPVPYALNLTLDGTCQLEIERLYAHLARLDVPDHDLVTQYGPCVTLLVLTDRVPPKEISMLLEWRLPTLSALAVTFATTCVTHDMPPTFGLRVAASSALLELHNAIYSELPEAEVNIHYRPAYWQPHLKLSNVRDEQAGIRLAAALAPHWTPFGGTIDGLEVVQYPPAQSIWQATLRPQK